HRRGAVARPEPLDPPRGPVPRRSVPAARIVGAPGAHRGAGAPVRPCRLRSSPRPSRARRTARLALGGRSAPRRRRQAHAQASRRGGDARRGARAPARTRPPRGRSDARPPVPVQPPRRTAQGREPPVGRIEEGTMCGIVGYTGSRAALSVLVPALRRLEYRGYDSAGIATLNGHGLELCKSVGKIAALEEALAQAPPQGR